MVERKSSNDYRRFFSIGKLMFQTNDLLSIPEDPDVINIDKSFKSEVIKTKKDNNKKNFSDKDRININVSGLHFETLKSTLEFYPNTLLGNEERRKYFYDSIHNEYFFDRHRSCFDAILYYYQSNGRLRRPNFVSIDTFLEEITFFDLGEQALAQAREEENLKELKKISLPRNRFRRYLWATLEHPEFSFIAKCVQILSVFVVLLSTLALAIESLPQYKNLNNNTSTNDNNQQILIKINQTNNTDQLLIVKYNYQNYFSSPFIIIQTVCIIYFTLELILRIISMPSLYGFINSFMNWIDILSILPYYIGIIIFFTNQGFHSHSKTQSALQLLRILRFVRVFKFYRIFRNIKAIRVLAITLTESFVDFIILAAILTLLGFVFGAILYYIENDINGTQFNSIFTATYWGIITITTVGYGDLAPSTPGGRIIGCFCAVSGTGTIAMLTSILVDRYQRVYNRRMYIKRQEIHFDDVFNIKKNDLESKHYNQDRASLILNDNHVKEQEHQYILHNEQNNYLTQIKDNEENFNSSIIDTINQDRNQIYFTVYHSPNTTNATIVENKLNDTNMNMNN
ncbi:unnamed protein product [Rotaria sp. Silwood1]|nr:unnamed protein product [Rotaria sp. Silwood1]CAF1653636.1 unnamed protein product [Rotaria sp. Silwood1]CAF3888363.1 unnamed protein product [Rotaria sp. Silwood1]CAF4965812.1 unnamed protein product [Rotaria sp. Silwood1]